MNRSMLTVFLASTLVGCGGGSSETASGTTVTASAADGSASEKTREMPPASAAPKDVHFPPVVRATLPNGLEVNTVTIDTLPIVYAELVVQSGRTTDPKALPGLAQVTGDMLTEGTRTRTAAQLADEIDFLGARVTSGTSSENSYVSARSLKQNFAKVADLMADVALAPAFRDDELKKLKKRETDRLTMMDNEPRYLANRTIYKALYGEHPYAVVDTTKDALKKMKRTDLAAWHRSNFVPSNARLFFVGAITPEEAKATAERVFGKWKGAAVTKAPYPATPTRDAREIIVVDRPGSEQSVLYVGNLALTRSNPEYIPLVVANQVLGGGAASRLFMDLREKRSLSYGAYSGVRENVDVAPFIAMANVRNAVTKEAVAGMFEHLDRIVTESVPDGELTEAKRNITDSFPLQIETASNVLDMVADLRLFSLPDNYWDTYRSEISKVTPAEALAAAKKYIHPNAAVIVVVGKAADVIEPLRAYGNVTVVDTRGNVTKTVDAAK
ncbi:MAG: pitrilysin family protein [Polyangiales bacterium]|nr:insulinase family protein [Myxococcales bacterium]